MYMACMRKSSHRVIVCFFVVGIIVIISLLVLFIAQIQENEIKFVYNMQDSALFSKHISGAEQ